MKRSIAALICVALCGALFVLGCSEDASEIVRPATPSGPQAADGPDKSDGYSFLPHTPELSGMSHVGILLVEFESTQANFPLKSFQEHPEYAGEIETLMFSTDPTDPSVHNLYQEMSDDAAGFTGQVIGSYVISDTYNDQCGGMDSTYRFARNRAAYAVADAAGADFEPYDVLMYVFSTDNPCAPIWILISEAFFMGSYPELDRPEVHMSNWSWSPTDFAHELGHLYGFGHSGDGVTTYGDYSCFMGDNTDYTGDWAPAPLRHLNAYWKAAIEYVDPDEIHVIEGEADEVFQLAPSEYRPAEVAPGAHRVARVMSEEGTFYVTYRQPRAPFDINEHGTRGWERMANRVLVHKRNGWNSIWLATLEDGDSYEGGDFRITAHGDGLDGDVEHVDVRVELGDIWDCGQGIEMSCAEPIRYANVAPHRPQSFQLFDIVLTSLDVPQCDPVTYTANQTAGSGNLYFVAAPDQVDVIVEGGGTATYAAGMEFQAIPPDGNYGVTTTITKDGQIHTQHLTWVLDTVAPAAPANPAVAVTAANTVTFSWNAVNDYPAGVDFYEVERDGAVVASPETNSFVDGGLSLDVTYTYRVRATDKAGNVGDWSDAVAVEIPSIVISDIQVTHNGIDCTKTVTWTTNVPSSSVVYFGNSCAALGYASYGAGNTTTHTVVCDVYDLSAFAFQVSSSANYVTATSNCTTGKRGKCISM